MKTKVILIGVGGATCSGKTTLAKHLRSILPDSVIIHQDDFAPPQELVPLHPIHNVQDWDAPAGAITWHRLVKFLQNVKETGQIPPDHRSHDHLNEQKEIKIDPQVRAKWINEFKHIKAEKEDALNERIIWGLVDGFLLYWNQDVIDQLDVRIMLRVPYDVLKKRRHERHGYHTAVQSDPEGSLWRDPPGYWDDVVYPAYVEAHKDLFEDGDVEHGKPTSKIKDLTLLESLDISMTEGVERCCNVIKDAFESL
ncbi:P-loop containing nucleoside triphosphate hydrolase protein [Gymnopilus junonius]|uniref:P-loop containing nucleoside triphosphate hydrolase protein n=1 Tax=Gymnopilus junonius TaxID=109634 RepID=A0A9P5TQ07_GYMJU|nr:P-loop containing nucleoside triphosphate hydrolase protein [Gymnopilus junonius]